MSKNCLIIIIGVLVILGIVAGCMSGLSRGQSVDVDGYVKKTNIPKTIYQCYHDKSKIPPKVYNNISTFAPNYKHKIYDNDECRYFLRESYGEKYVDIFNYLLKDGAPAHAADFWRYCILYKYGGVYLDIKIELIESMDETVNRLGNCNFSTVLSIINKTCMQGVIVSTPNHPILKMCIDKMKKTYKKSNTNYHIYTGQMYENISRYTRIKTLKDGSNKDVFLFKESCSENKNDCSDGLDKYGSCCFVTDNGENVIKSRYAEYPW